MDQGSDPPGGERYVFALRDEEAYLQTDDEKPVFVHPPPEPAQSKCWFCRKSRKQVQRLFGAEYPVRAPNNFSNETLIYICNECVAKFAGWFASEGLGPSR